MSVIKQLYDFIFFTILGIIISCIFDVFRSLRKVRKKNSIYIVMLQDIIFFVIITIMTIIYMIEHIDDRIRGYMFLAIILGIAVSRKVLSGFLITIFSKIIITFKELFLFTNIHIILYAELCIKLCKKICKICCKLFFYMINLKCKLLSVFGNKNNFEGKRGLEK